MLISLIANLSNTSPLDSCIRDLTRAGDDGSARVWLTQMPSARLQSNRVVHL